VTADVYMLMNIPLIYITSIRI